MSGCNRDTQLNHIQTKCICIPVLHWSTILKSLYLKWVQLLLLFGLRFDMFLYLTKHTMILDFGFNKLLMIKPVFSNHYGSWHIYRITVMLYFSLTFHMVLFN